LHDGISVNNTNESNINEFRNLIKAKNDNIVPLLKVIAELAITATIELDV